MSDPEHFTTWTDSIGPYFEGDPDLLSVEWETFLEQAEKAAKDGRL